MNGGTGRTCNTVYTVPGIPSSQVGVRLDYEKLELQSSKLWEAEEGVQYIEYLYSLSVDGFQ